MFTIKYYFDQESSTDDIDNSDCTNAYGDDVKWSYDDSGKTSKESDGEDWSLIEHDYENIYVPGSNNSNCIGSYCRTCHIPQCFDGSDRIVYINPVSLNYSIRFCTTCSMSGNDDWDEQIIKELRNEPSFQICESYICKTGTCGTIKYIDKNVLLLCCDECLKTRKDKPDIDITTYAQFEDKQILARLRTGDKHSCCFCEFDVKTASIRPTRFYSCEETQKYPVLVEYETLKLQMTVPELE